MKNSSRLIATFAMILCFLASNAVSAQTDKEELKLQRLRDNVSRYEAKVTDKERRLEIADSLISTGENMIFEAEEEFELVEKEGIALDKEYKIARKELTKLQKSKNEETADKAEADMKALDLKYKADVKIIETKIKQLTRNATKGQSNIERGKEKQKLAMQALKEAQEGLDIAREKLAAAQENK